MDLLMRQNSKFELNLHSKERFEQRVAPYFSESPHQFLASCTNPRKKELAKFRANQPRLSNEKWPAKILTRRLNELVFVAVVYSDGKSRFRVKTFLVWENRNGHLQRFNVP